MKYLDAKGEELQVGDYVIYGKSGYVRGAKLLSVTPPSGNRNYTWEYSLMTYSHCSKFAVKRKSSTWVGQLNPAEVTIWSLWKVDSLEPETERIIEARVQKDLNGKR